MREIVLDTETTGLEPAEGHRIVEIGALELENLVPTGRTCHHYINPGRDMPEGAFGVHGIGPDLLVSPREAGPGEVTLRDKPAFADVARDFVAFIGDAKLVIHNASFDMKFLNAELRWMGLPELDRARAVDTLALARQKYPGAPASLDALSRRFGVDASARTLHGALLDSQILAEVYLQLLGGRQPDFGLSAAGSTSAQAGGTTPLPRRPVPLPPRLTEGEAAAHAALIDELGDGAIWKRYG